MSEILIYNYKDNFRTPAPIPVEEMDIFGCDGCFEEYKEMSYQQDAQKLFQLRLQLDGLKKRK